MFAQKKTKQNSVYEFIDFYPSKLIYLLEYIQFSFVQCSSRSKMAASNRLLPHVSSIETETQIRLLGFPRPDENLRADFRPEIRKPESRYNFDARSGEESSSSARVQRKTGRILLQSPRVRKKERYLRNVLFSTRNKIIAIIFENFSLVN